MLRTYIKALRGIKEKERCFLFKALEFPRNIKIVLTIYMVFDVKKSNEVQFEFFQRYAPCEESLNLENKNMLRTFLGLKLKKIRTSEGFLQFWCSYKKTYNKRFFDNYKYMVTHIKLSWVIEFYVASTHKIQLLVIILFGSPCTKNDIHFFYYRNLYLVQKTITDSKIKICNKNHKNITYQPYSSSSQVVIWQLLNSFYYKT